MTTNTHIKIAPFNTIQGIASNNVPAYSNGDGEVFSVEHNFVHGVFTGMKWQCVEYARRWLFLRKQCTFNNIRHAADIFTDITHIERVTDGKSYPLRSYPNGSTHRPESDSLLIFSRSSEHFVGHVAIICEVLPNCVRIAEQNIDSNYWPGNYARELPLTEQDGKYFIKDDTLEITGWLEIEDNHELEPIDESKTIEILEQYRKPMEVGEIQRCQVDIKDREIDENWLDPTSPAEKYFIDWYGASITRANSDTLPYYTVDFNFLSHFGTVSNELHRMFMQATDRVINDDDLLTRFCIPNVFWPHIRRSWTNEKNLQMSGRFDIAFDGKQLKVFEYNADSASALFECSTIVPKWAKAVKLPSPFTTGIRTHSLLVNNLKRLDLTQTVHILIDEERDEMLTALYMRKAMDDAKIKAKICISNHDFVWKDGSIFDNEGEPVTFVWKLWMWETIFKDYFNGQKEREQSTTNGSTWKPTDGERPRLSDILVNDNIRVMEPIWKVVTSNKALLPILWSMFPNHPNLLRSEWTLSDDLQKTGYAMKPIVGRCGQNVTLYNADSKAVLEQTDGKFVDRNCIYQELFHLKNFDGYYFIMGSWIIHGFYGGFCIREDQKLITDVDSPVTACCVVWK